MRTMITSGNRHWLSTRTLAQTIHATTIIYELQGKSLAEIEQHCTNILEGHMGKAAEAQFGFCLDCREGDHEACKSNQCRCRQTDFHNEAIGSTKDNEQDLPEGFSWEEPPVKPGRHPLTPEKKILLKTRPGKFAHIKHYDGKSSAYQAVKNFNAGKFKDLDMNDWDFRDVKDGVHGSGSDLYVAYIGEE